MYSILYSIHGGDLILVKANWGTLSIPRGALFLLLLHLTQQVVEREINTSVRVELRLKHLPPATARTL
jgi:hypothetical protein